MERYRASRHVETFSRLTFHENNFGFLYQPRGVTDGTRLLMPCIWALIPIQSDFTRQYHPVSVNPPTFPAASRAIVAPNFDARMRLDRLYSSFK